MMRTTAILYALVMWSAATGTAWAADHSTIAVVGQANSQPLQRLIEAELTAALSEHAGMVIVDRSRIDNLLAEQEWSTAQLVRQPLKGGRMIGAQFIVYFAHESSPGGHRVSLIAVETESGNVIGERAWRLAAGPDPDTRPLVQDATRLIRAGVARSQAEADHPAATVLHVTDQSALDRTSFLAGVLRGLTESQLEQRGYRVLRRRYAGRLKNETLLGISGLMRPDAAVLAEAADCVVSIEYREKPDPKLTFSQTPIELKLTVQRNGVVLPSAAIGFTLEELTNLPTNIGQALPSAKVGFAPDNLEAVEHAQAEDAQQTQRRIEAAQLFAQLDTELPWADRANHARRIQRCERIIYLDPTIAETYYLLGISHASLSRDHSRSFEERREHYPACIEAMDSYLRFPRQDRHKVRKAFVNLIASYNGVLYAHAKDQRKVDKLCEQAMQATKDYSQWYCRTDWSDYKWANGPIILADGGPFERWWNAQPIRQAEFYDWVFMQVKGNASLGTSALAYTRLRAAIAWDRADQPAKAASRFYDALVGMEPSKQLMGNLRASYPRYVIDRTVKRYAAHLSGQQQAELRRAIARTAEERPPITDMYGDFFGKPKDIYDMAYKADRFLIADLPAADVSPESLGLPEGLLATNYVTHTPSGLWFVGLANQPETGEPVWLHLYHWPDESKPIRRIDIPDDWRKPDGMRIPGAAPLRTISIVQAGGEIVWCASHMMLGGSVAEWDVPGSLFAYRLKDGRFKAYGMNDGIPHERIVYIRQGPDPNAAVLITTPSTFRKNKSLAIYRDGDFFVAGSPAESIGVGLLLTEHATFDIGYGDSAIRVGGPNANKMRELVDWQSIKRHVSVPGYVQLGRSRGSNIAYNRAVRCGDRVYLAAGRGLVEMNMAGEIVKLRRPMDFWYWKELGGFIEGNCPLPPIDVRQVIVDDAQPHKLWIVSRDHEMFPREIYYPHYGKLVADNDFDHRSDANDGLFVTCFDTITNRWSKPHRFNGRYVMVQPFGEHLYFTGDGLRRVPKSAWRADQRPQDGPPRVLTADTLHGRASAALFDGDFDRTRELLEQAIEQGIAVDETRKMLKALAGLEREGRQ
jgi:hypothetical protein